MRKSQVCVSMYKLMEVINLNLCFSCLNVLRCELQLTTLPECMLPCFLLANDDKEDTDLPRAKIALWEQSFSTKIKRCHNVIV